jgi:hypothetical protein
MKFIKIILYLTIVLFLTALTQIGGIVFILSGLIYTLFIKKIKDNFGLKVLTFCSLYFFTTFVVIPPIAKIYGRVPLSVYLKNNVRPTNVWTCILNRNYVQPDLKNSIYNVAKTLETRYNGAEIRYLDANLPFYNGFPLFPHLSHNDGRKIDISFFYLSKKTHQPSNEKPAISGYGEYEIPKKGERNRPLECEKAGYWQYSFPQYLTLGSNIEYYEFDEVRTKAMIELFEAEENIEKMFLEPHLQERMGLVHEKIRLHGCNTVRHDDHLHIQIKR